MSAMQRGMRVHKTLTLSRNNAGECPNSLYEPNGHRVFERRSPQMILHRLLSAYMGIVFVLATTDPMSGRPCQTREGASEAMPAMPGMPAMPHDHDSSPHHSHRCACLDSCCCAVVVTIANDRLVALPIVPIAVIAMPRTIISSTRRPSQPDSVVLPPPIGPPASHV